MFVDDQVYNFDLRHRVNDAETIDEGVKTAVAYFRSQDLNVANVRW